MIIEYNNSNNNTQFNTEPPKILKRRRSDINILNLNPNIAPFETKKVKYTKKNTQCSVIDQKIGLKANDAKLTSTFLNKFSGEIKEQATLITRSPRFHCSTEENQIHIRSLILNIAENASLGLEEKCAELGVLYFYVASKETVCNSNFLKFRTNELVEKFNDLKIFHKKCPEHLQKLIPSGRRAYLFHEFVRMVFLDDGSFNPGGCRALKIMMNGPIQLYITDEVRLQIIRLADRLLTDEDFVGMFLEPIEIHEDIKELISIDLQLKKDGPIKPIHVRQDLLMALIGPVAQIAAESNCFAIGAAGNTLVNNPDMVIKILIEILKTGNFTLDDKQIPASMLLEGSRGYEEDFSKEITPQAISDLMPFLKLKDCLNIPEETKTHSTSMSLNAYMALEFKEEKEYAKQLYLSFKQNLLQKLFVAVVQYSALNILHDSNIELIGTMNSSAKDKFANRIIKFIDQYIYETEDIDSDSDENLKNYLEKIKKGFLESFYLIDYKNTRMDIEDGMVIYDFHEKGLKFNGNPNEYVCFMEQRRLFFYENGNPIAVDSISKFKECFQNIITNLQKQTRTKKYHQGTKFINSFMNSKDFESNISEIIYGLNITESVLDPNIYQNSDSLILAQSGCGLNYLELWPPLKSRLSPCKISAKNISSYFFQLCKLFSHYPAFAEKNSWVLIEYSDHLYNLYPFKFKDYWEGKKITKDKKNILEIVTIDRAGENNTFTVEKKKRILSEVLNETDQNSIDKLIYSSLNPRKFSKEVKKLLPEDQHQKVNPTINKIMNEIPVEEIREKLKEILAFIGKDASSEASQRIVWAAIESMGDIYPYITPYHLAKAIYKCFASENIQMTVSREGLESHIRKITSMPEVIDIGNFNWIDDLQEKTRFAYLSIKYDFVHGLVFCMREKGNEKNLSAERTQYILDTNTLYIPKQSERYWA